MFNTIAQQPYIKHPRLTTAFLSLIGVTLVASVEMSVHARPIIINEPILPTTQVIGSPIPSPIPLIPGTTIPYSSLNNYRNSNTIVVPGRTIINNSPYYDNYRDYNTVIVPGGRVINNPLFYDNYRDYNTVIVPGSRIINNSTIINPRIINPRISDSVLINPVIINSPRYPVAPLGGSRFIYNAPGVRIRLGQ